MANLTKLKDLWVLAESTFSVDPDSDGSDYLHMLAEGVEATFTHAPIERDVARPGLLQSIASVPGQKGGTISFKTPIHGLATAGAATVAAVMDPWLQTLFEACGYTVAENTGTAVIGSPTGTTTTTVVEVDSAAAITAGAMVMIDGQVRLVTAVNTTGTDTITVTPALSSAPAGATVVYACGGAVLVSGSAYEPTTCAFVFKHDGTEVTALGCAGTVKIDSFDAATRPMLSWEFQVNTFDTTSNKSSVPTAAATARTNLLAKRSTGATTGSALFYGSTATALATSRTMFDPGLTLSPKPSVNGIEGRIGWAITDEAAKFEVTPYNAQSTYWTAYAAGTIATTVVQLGNAGGAAFGIAAQSTQIESLPTEQDVGGIRGSGLVLRVREPSTAGLPGFVIALF
jgi:hypothetical protein